MRRRAACVAVALALGAAGLFAQTAAGSLALQGRWVVIGGEHQGRPMDGIEGGVMTISGRDFEIRTASGTILTGTLRLDTSRAPFRVDMLHADGARWEAIYEVTGDRLRLSYVDAEGKDPRPDAFITSGATEASSVTLRRRDL